MSIKEQSSHGKLCLQLYRKSMRSRDMAFAGLCFEEMNLHTFIVLGASGNLATTKIYPALWWLYRDKLIPQQVRFVGYSRTVRSIEEMSKSYKTSMKVANDEEECYAAFWKLNMNITGSYQDERDYKRLNERILIHEKGVVANRIFHLALPPFLYETVVTRIKAKCMSASGWNRIILEKPFGHDLESCLKLTTHISSLYTELELYRIDHFLGKEMVLNLMTLRFANRIFGPIWNRDNIACVLISFKEQIGLEGRAAYFNEYGIIRDVMQNHLMQILSLVAMEKPVSCQAEEIRNEKVRVLKCIRPITLEESVVGQYVGNPWAANDKEKESFLDSEGIPKDSITPTFAVVIVHINNERWDGVPFILKGGKALNDRKTEVRVQFKDAAGDIFESRPARNELVIRVQPGEAIYIKFMVKTPGTTFSMEETELDLNYSSRYSGIKLPDAYERLLLDVFCGSQMHFVRSDELIEAWRIFTPLLHQLKRNNIKPIQYVFGTRGPTEADQLVLSNGFVYTGSYKWTESCKNSTD